MLLGSKDNGYGTNRTYSLHMDQSEYAQALAGKPLYRVTVSNNIAGEWTVRFKKFGKAKRKRMNLI